LGYRVLLTVILLIVFCIVGILNIISPETIYKTIIDHKKVTKLSVLIFRLVTFLWIIGGLIFLYMVWTNRFKGI